MANKELNIDLPPEIAGGNYSNFSVITHSNSEFLLDFVQRLPGLPKPRVASRIILTPDHAKRLLAALADNVAKYEREFGEITIKTTLNNPPMLPTIGFSGGEA